MFEAWKSGMTGLYIFSWFILIVLVLAVIVGFVVLAMLPGKLARQRGHPQQEAINVAGWAGALLGGVFWPLALIWAFTRSPFFEAAAPPGESSSKDAEAGS